MSFILQVIAKMTDELTEALVTALGSSEIAKVRVRVPPFWQEKPTVWFSQIEAQFALSNITSDATKYYTVVGNLEPSIMAQLEDVLENPPTSNKYEKLKTELIKRLSVSQEKKVRQLLIHEELGDRKPSAFLRHLQSLAGRGVPDDFLRTIWTSRLPTSLQAIIASQVATPLEAVAELADRVLEIAPVNPVAQVASTSSAAGSILEVMRTEIASLTRKFDELTTKVERQSRTGRPDRSRNRRFSRSRTRSRGRTNKMADNRGICWYHYKFGEKAHHCNKPCDFVSENAKASR